MKRFQFSLARSLLALVLIVAALASLDLVFAGCGISLGIVLLSAAFLFCYVAICVLVAPPAAKAVGDPERKVLRCFAPLRRPQFSLKTLFWLMVVVGAFYAGAARERSAYLTNVGHWNHQRMTVNDQNQKLQMENAALRKQIDADHERWRKSPKAVMPE